MRNSVYRHDTERAQNFRCTLEHALPVVPSGQLVHTTSLVLGTMAQVAPAGHGHGLQSDGEPTVASP